MGCGHPTGIEAPVLQIGAAITTQVPIFDFQFRFSIDSLFDKIHSKTMLKKFKNIIIFSENLDYLNCNGRSLERRVNTTNPSKTTGQQTTRRHDRSADKQMRNGT